MNAKGSSFGTNSPSMPAPPGSAARSFSLLGALAFAAASTALPGWAGPPLAQAGDAFDQLWSAFDRDYSMFVLRPEVDWNQSREQFRPLATNCTSVSDLANVFVQMLQPLRDWHVGLTVSGSYLPTFAPPVPLNANRAAYHSILGSLNSVIPQVQWAVTTEKIGFIAINAWNDSQIPTLCQEALEQMRDTRGLIVDVRSNGGGDSSLAKAVARRFEHTNFVYGFYQVRNGTNHTDLTAKKPMTISPSGPWRYDRPVILLMGQVSVSSDELFIGMMTGATNVTTMGDHTRGSSANPETVQLPYDMTVRISTWIYYLADGTLLDERGYQPQIPFTPGPDAFTGTNDALLSAAIQRLRQVPLPAQPILGPVFSQTTPLTFDGLPHSQSVSNGYAGRNWTNFWSYNTQAGSYPGFKAGVISAPGIIYNHYGSPATISGNAPFDLLSAYLTAGFNSNLNVEVIGYIGAYPAYDMSVTLNPTGPTAVQFNYCAVTSVRFVSSGGTPYYSPGGTHFVMDNLVITPHTMSSVRPLLQNLTRASGTTTFTWAAQAGQTYQVQYSADLSQTNWSNLGSPLTTGNYTLTGFDAATNQQRFYRVVVLP